MADTADRTSAPDLSMPVRAHGTTLASSLIGGLVTAIPVLIVGMLLLAFAPAYLIRVGFAGYVNLIIVVGLQVFMGNSMVANLGQGAFVGIGAYAAAILSTPVKMKALSIPRAPFGLSHWSIDPLSATAAGLGVTAIVAMLTGLVVARLVGEAATIVTFSILMIVHAVFIHWTDLFKGAQAFFGIPQVVDLQTAMAVSVVVIVIARVFKDSQVGLQLRASAENLLAAKAFGVDVWRVRLIGWVLGAVICGLAGVLYAFFMGTINARAFHFELVMTTLAMLILGGLRTVTGAVFGAILLSFLLEAIRTVENGVTVLGFELPSLLGLSGLAMGVVIVLGMTLQPKGLFPRLEIDEILRRMMRGRKGGAMRSANEGEDTE